jgi:hypothetical protein
VESFYAAISYPHGRDALLRDPAWHVSKLVFGLLPWPLTRVQRIWHLFASMDVPRRIARERVPWQWEEICTSSLILTRMGDRGK